jgi:DNA polymerase-3 subunit epsilon
MQTIFLDTETTGLDPAADGILEIGILADDGPILLDSLVRPVHATRWPEAQRIHGIDPEDVKDAPPLDALRPAIVRAATGAEVVIYNAAFDAGFLHAELRGAAAVRCAMLAFAEVCGEWSDWHGDDRWQKLRVAAAHVGHQWSGTAAHWAIRDCAATRAVWRYCTDPTERGRIDAIHKEAKTNRAGALELQWLEQERALARQAHQVRMSPFWMRWLRLRGPATLTRADRDRLCLAFAGHAEGVLDELRAGPTVPVYHRRQDVPPALRPASRIRREIAPWVLDAMVLVAVLATPQRVSWRYSRGEAMRLKAAALPRHERWQDVPEGLLTRSRYRAELGKDPVQGGLAPVAEVRLRSRRRRVYAPLYPPP